MTVLFLSICLFLLTFFCIFSYFLYDVSSFQTLFYSFSQ